MSVENGEWVLHGLRYEDPKCLRSPEAVLDYVNTVGFLPLFGNTVPGFSVEEHTAAEHWWCEFEDLDPWLWREELARGGKVAYGKFFAGKAGFISLEWLPAFCNWRRDGYDFDARWDDEKASIRQKKIMDCFLTQPEYYTFELKKAAGFGKGGEKGFEQTVTGLQMQTYLLLRDFRQRRNRAGECYGWPIAVLSTPEQTFGEELASAAYHEEPEQSKERIYSRLRECFPGTPDEAVRAILGK